MAALTLDREITEEDAARINAAFSTMMQRLQESTDTLRVVWQPLRLAWEQVSTSPSQVAPTRLSPPPAPPRQVNVALFRDALQEITDNPESHDQDVWAKRTANGTVVGCLAYHVTRLAGHQLNWAPGWAHSDGYHTGYVLDANGNSGGCMCDVAARLLGISSYQSVELFGPGNTIDQLWAIAGRLTNGEITRPPARKVVDA